MLIIVVRTVVIYLLVVASMRIMGKRQLGELEPSEFVTAIMISELAAIPIAEPDKPVLHAVVSIAALLIAEFALSVIMLKSNKARSLLCGKPSVLIDAGVISEKELRKNRFTVDELVEELRINGVTDISEAKYAVLEGNGRLSVIKGETLPQVVAADGRFIEENAKTVGFDAFLAERELKKRGAVMKDVLLMTADKAGKVFLALKGG